jgi:hypothetical protein
VSLAATSGFRILALRRTKIKMNKTMETAETDRLWPIIETLNWEELTTKSHKQNTKCTRAGREWSRRVDVRG